MWIFSNRGRAGDEIMDENTIGDEMTVERRQDPGAPEKRGLKLSGSVTIGQAALFREALLDALGAAGELEVDLCGVTEIDLTGLQLLCAAHQSAQAAGKNFSVNDGGNRAYLDTVANAGFQRHVGCARDNSGTCIWLGGEC
jgi:ABC-type transporter Mla MlaB component